MCTLVLININAHTKYETHSFTRYFCFGKYLFNLVIVSKYTCACYDVCGETSCVCSKDMIGVSKI